MSKNPDIAIITELDRQVDDLYWSRGADAAADAAAAALTTVRDIARGAAVVTKDAGHVRATYKSTTSPELAASLKAALDLLGENGLVLALKALVSQRQAATKAASDPWRNPDFSNMTPR